MLKRFLKKLLVATGTLAEVYLDSRGLHRPTPTPDSKLYLRRFRLLRTPWGRIHLHRIYTADTGRDLHNHPYAFRSIILSGGYDELRHVGAEPVRDAVTGNPVVDASGQYAEQPALRTLSWRQGDINRVGAEARHRLVAVLPDTWTLVLGGATVQNWGFFTAGGFVEHWGYQDVLDAEAAAAPVMPFPPMMPPMMAATFTG